MPDESNSRPESRNGPLRPMRANAKWTSPAAIAGVALLMVSVVLAFVAPSPLWFLLYPVLIVGAVGALTATAAWLIRHF